MILWAHSGCPGSLVAKKVWSFLSSAKRWGDHLAQGRRVQVNMKVFRDLHTLLSIIEGQCQEKWLNLGRKKQSAMMYIATVHHVWCYGEILYSGELPQEKTFVNWKIKILQKKLMQIATKPWYFSPWIVFCYTVVVVNRNTQLSQSSIEWFPNANLASYFGGQARLRGCCTANLSPCEK